VNISTRIAHADDNPAIWQLYVSAMKHHIEAIWGWDAAWQSADFDNAFATSSTYVVELDGWFSGYVQLDLGPVENYLRMIVLAPECRSSGIGARLLAEILRRSLDGGRNLYLRVFRNNIAAKRFYEREGWSVASEDENFYLLRHATVPAPVIFNASPTVTARQFEICMY
jgi:ribosomal protein S18 acetylase RimI-like enzyme